MKNKTIREPVALLESFLPKELWSEVLPNLWQGGTDDLDTLCQSTIYQVTKDDFDLVVTLYASANPVGWFVKELRLGFYDQEIETQRFDTNELKEIVNLAHSEWKKGKRVLVRCQAGLNRSGLVMALMLIKDGLSPREAIDLIRSRRSPYALCNLDFEDWLLGLDVKNWR